jgi:phosphatidylserine/phosphatidylglycerophosphate/cardiolipin synthase-like enzyme
VLDYEQGSSDMQPVSAVNMPAFDAKSVLKKANIDVVDGGRSSGLMHTKFIIVDSTILFMGSWNMSYNDTFRNNNNLLQITNQKLIANYQAKFNEMFEQKLFGTKADLQVETHQFTIDGTRVDNFFAPADKVMDKLVAEVKTAKRSIKFMVFTYTHADLANAMIERAKAGVQVQGVIENRGASQGALPALFCAKLPVKTDGNKYTMHDKVIIIDDSTVITGSFNFTKSADESNDENVLIIRNSNVAAAFVQEFNKIYATGQTPDSVKC